VAVATLDLKHFGAVSIKGTPRLLPRDAGKTVRPPTARRSRAG
jgi:hypothetical protein